jgi:hypothetical protein
MRLDAAARTHHINLIIAGLVRDQTFAGEEIPFAGKEIPIQHYTIVSKYELAPLHHIFGTDFLFFELSLGAFEDPVCYQRLRRIPCEDISQGNVFKIKNKM